VNKLPHYFLELIWWMLIMVCSMSKSKLLTVLVSYVFQQEPLQYMYSRLKRNWWIIRYHCFSQIPDWFGHIYQYEVSNLTATLVLETTIKFFLQTTTKKVARNLKNGTKFWKLWYNQNLLPSNKRKHYSQYYKCKYN
jgi:hypothetical protein